MTFRWFHPFDAHGELRAMFTTILERIDTMGSRLDALTQVDAAMGAAITDHLDAQQQELAALATDVAALGNQPSDADITALATSMQGKVDTLTAATTALRASLAAPATPTT